MSNNPSVSVSVYHRDKKGALRRYDSRTSEAVLAAAATGVARLSVECGATFLTFDLKTMKQIKRPSEELDIVIEIPCESKRLKAAGGFKPDHSIRRKVLIMAVDRLREQQSLHRVLDLKCVRYQSVRKNPYLGPGHEPYEKFIDSLMAATLSKRPQTGEVLYDAILEIASVGPTEENMRYLKKQGVHLVFHGTDQANMDNILNTGLLPQFRKAYPTDRDWFGAAYRLSACYTGRKTSGGNLSKVLFFMVLHPDTKSLLGVTSLSSRYQLPLAEITLEGLDITI